MSSVDLGNPQLVSDVVEHVDFETRHLMGTGIGIAPRPRVELRADVEPILLRRGQRAIARLHRRKEWKGVGPGRRPRVGPVGDLGVFCPSWQGGSALSCDGHRRGKDRNCHQQVRRGCLARA